MISVFHATHIEGNKVQVPIPISSEPEKAVQDDWMKDDSICKELPRAANQAQASQLKRAICRPIYLIESHSIEETRQRTLGRNRTKSNRSLRNHSLARSLDLDLSEGLYAYLLLQ